MNIEDCKLNQLVKFGRPNGQKTLGQIVKINQKTIGVKTLEDRGSKSKAGEVWKCHPGGVWLAENQELPELPDDSNPEYILEGVCKSLLQQIADGTIDMKALARKRLASQY